MNHASSSQFWLNNPSSLFSSFNLFPDISMSIPEILNCVTRLILLISLLLFLFKVPYWYLFPIIGLLLIIVLYYRYSSRHPSLIENFRCIPPTIQQSDKPKYRCKYSPKYVN